MKGIRQLGARFSFVATFTGLTICAGAQSSSRIAADHDARQSVVSYGNSGSKSISANGRWLVYGVPFPSGVASPVGLFLRDLLNGEVTPVSIGWQGDPRPAYMPTVSADGSVVAFLSADAELVANDTNQSNDVFVWERSTGQVRRVSVDSAGNQTAGAGPVAVISGDGSTVAFASTASDLVPGDTNGELDFFIHHLATGLTLRVSEGSNGEQGVWTCFWPGLQCALPQTLDISDNGQFIAFASYLTNLVSNDSVELDVFVHDWFARTTERVSEAAIGGDANDWSWYPSISADGRWVAFHSGATNLVSSGPTVAGSFLRDRSTGNTVVIGTDPYGNHVWSLQPVLSSNGEYVAFLSDANLVVPDDQDGELDLFVQRLGTTDPLLASRGRAGANLALGQDGWEWDPYFTAHGVTNDGRVMFRAAASAIVGEPSGPQTPFTVVLHDPSMRTNAVSDYCTAKTNTLGCVPRMTVCGAPSMSAGQRFALIAENVRSHKTGFLMWARSAQAAPFDGGTMCIGTPRRRTAAQDSGGASSANDCTGAYSFWFDPAYVTSMGLAPGDVVYAQYYSRDPWNLWPSNVGLTNAIRFVVLP